VEDYDLLIYVASWPKVRATAWDALLRARAIENVSYVVGVNRMGEDAGGHAYIGHSQVVDYLGEFVLEPQESEAIFTATLDKSKLIETRKKFAFLNDRDSFKLKS
jgi:predicted amidohydrolase